MNSSVIAHTHPPSRWTSIVEATVDTITENQCAIRNGIQRTLLLAATAGAILTAIPPLRFHGAVTVRSTACLSALVDSAFGEKNLLTRAQDCVKIAAAALGLAGFVTATPGLIIASLVTDVALQAISLTKSACQGNTQKALIHASILAIDVLAVAGIALASSKLIAIAGAVSFIGLFLILGASFDKWLKHDGNCLWTFVDNICYTLIAGLSTATTLFTLTFHKDFKDRSLFDVKNESDHLVVLYDRKGNQVAQVLPHETLLVDLPYEDTLHHTGYRAMPAGDGSYSIYPVSEGSYIQGVMHGDNGMSSMQKWDATSITTGVRQIGPLIEPKDYPALPLGGPNTVLTISDEDV